MISLTCPAEEAGIAVLAAGARTAMHSFGGDAECVGLVVRQLGVDARRRLGDAADTAPLTLTAEVRGTEFVVTLHDQGEPVSAPPDGVLVLLDSGLATGADARTDGLGNLTEVRFALPTHHRLLDASAIEVIPEDAPSSPEEVTLRPLVADDAAALTRLVYRCYSWSYPNAELYYPDRIASAVATGERIGFVAATGSGEIAAHWGAVLLSPTVVETGAAVTDPRFRRRGIAAELGNRVLARLEELGMRGRLREPVMTHPATQQIALREGATVVGAYIHIRHPVEQIGITDGPTASRGSLTVAYSALQPLRPASVWIPGPFEPLARTVLDAADWPRALEQPRAHWECPQHSELSTAYESGNRSGTVDVWVAGHNLIDEIHTALAQMRRAGAEFVAVRLPANQPALANVGAGLVELGLGYAALIPEFRAATPTNPAGDVLITQWLADPDVDTSAWVFAADSVRDLVLRIVDQLQDAGDRGAQRQRRAAHRAQLFAPLGD